MAERISTILVSRIQITIQGMTYGEPLSTWGCFKEACDNHGIVYNTHKMKKFPIITDGFIIHKLPFRKKP